MGSPRRWIPSSVIRKLVLEEKKITIQQLHQAMLDNFVGHEPLLSLMEREAPRFGNDNDEVDQLAADLLSFLLDRIYALNDGSYPEKFVHLLLQLYAQRLHRRSHAGDGQWAPGRRGAERRAGAEPGL